MITLTTEMEEFLEAYLKELQEDNAALFIGAGMSKAAGFVDWAGLLEDVAKKIGLDSRKEANLVSLAQYHYNSNKSRSVLNQLLLDEFSDLPHPSANHEIIARLPIKVIWTTNYDRLIEAALERSGKRVDAKYTEAHLATTKAGRDTVLYKMHGDIEHPDKAVLIRDDYEKYYLTHAFFTAALLGDLVERTFLFLGFSFTDPNLDFVLSRIRSRLGENKRRHYCITKKRTREATDTDQSFNYDVVKQKLVIDDLLEYNIKTILVDDYSQITELLRRVESGIRRKSVFISGSAHEFGSWSPGSASEFIARLARHLIDSDFRITSGLGLGVGSAVASGAIQAIYSSKHRSIERQLVLRPFPIGISDPAERNAVFERYRSELISQAGIAIFILGNSYDGSGTILATGVREEFDLARKKGLFVIPIGASEFICRELWNEVWSDYDNFFPGIKADAKAYFDALGKVTSDPMTLLDPLFNLIRILGEN